MKTFKQYLTTLPESATIQPMRESKNSVRAVLISDTDPRWTSYQILVAHAGRNDRTGAKVHRADLTIWKETGKKTIGHTMCGGNLKGTPITDGRPFTGNVTCAKCKVSDEFAKKLDNESITIDL